MNNIISYNEAIRWYKNGKLELYKDIEEPIVEKDLFIFKYNNKYYISRSEENLQGRFDDKGHLIHVTIFDRPIDDRLYLTVNLPSKVYENTPIKYIIHDELGKEKERINVLLKDLTIEIKERIINI